MTRLPRHVTRVKPPLRGRAATRPYRGDFAPITAVHRPLSPDRSSGPWHNHPHPQYPDVEHPVPAPEETNPPITYPRDNSLYAELVEFYKSWGRLLQRIDSPWKWMLAISIVISSCFVISQLP